MHFTQHVAWMGYMPKGTQHSYSYIYNMIHYGEDIRSKLTVHNTTPNSTIPLVSSQISTQPRGLARKILQRIQRSYAYIYIHIFINVR